MIESKTVLAVTYLVLVLFSVILPYFVMLFIRPSILREKWDRGLLWCFTAVPVLFLIPFGSIPKLWVSVVLSLPMAYFIATVRGIRLWGSILGFAVFSTVIWWPISTEFVLWRLIPFWAIGAASILVLRQDQGVLSKNAVRWTLAVVLILGILSHAFTGTISFGSGFATMWHHWGVYVATAQLLLSGAIPFVDFPLQYGLGPTVYMAMACQPDCWIGAYYAVTFVNICYLVSLTFGAALLMQRAPRGLALLSMLAVASAVLLWTIYPPDIMGPLGTPSTSGMRFLPIAALLLFIIRKEVCGETSPFWGYVIWSVSLIWSPEAAIFATMVWWPYLALNDVQNQSNCGLKRIAATAVLWVAIMFGATLVLMVVFSLIFWTIFGHMPDLNGYLAYILSPPGPLPAKLGGPLWVLLTVLALAGMAMLGADASETRLLTASMLATLAVTTYYLGRSHDNNILNLFPFITLSLIAALRTKLMPGAMGFGKAVLVGIVIWPSLFGLNGIKNTLSNAYGGQVGLSDTWTDPALRPVKSWNLIADFVSDLGSDDHGPNYGDLTMALQTIARLNQGVPIVINAASVLQIEGAPDFWTTMINPASYVVLPQSVIRHFVMQGRLRFDKSGWVILQHQDMIVSNSDWLDIFSSAYNIAETRSFGDYSAYRMVPK